MLELKIGKNEENQRIDKFLRKYMPKASLSFIYKIIRKKYVKVNYKKIEKDYLLQIEDTLQIYLSEETLQQFCEKKEIAVVPVNFKVIYEDPNLLLVEKPSGLLVHGNSHENKYTLINQVIKYLFDKGEYHPRIEKTFTPASVNRLDRNTSGIVIIGKNHETLQNLNEMMRNRESIKKYYLTIVKGHVKEAKALKGYLRKDDKKNKVEILGQATDHAKAIDTRYQPIKSNHVYSLLEVEILTGRSHQIRLHLASEGFPIIGDQKYGDPKTNKIFASQYGLNHQFLHAYKIEFHQCLGNLNYLEGKSFTSVLPKKLKNIEKDLFYKK